MVAVKKANSPSLGRGTQRWEDGMCSRLREKIDPLPAFHCKLGLERAANEPVAASGLRSSPRRDTHTRMIVFGFERCVRLIPPLPPAVWDLGSVVEKTQRMERPTAVRLMSKSGVGGEPMAWLARPWHDRAGCGGPMARLRFLFWRRGIREFELLAAIQATKQMGSDPAWLNANTRGGCDWLGAGGERIISTGTGWFPFPLDWIDRGLVCCC